MTQTEQQLSDLLHRYTPEPERSISSDDILARLDTAEHDRVRPIDTVRPRRGVLVAAAAIVITTAGAGALWTNQRSGGGGPKAGTSVGTATRVCTSDQLKLRVARNHTTYTFQYVVITATNVSKRACSVRGYPDFFWAAYNSAGSQRGAIRGAQRGPEDVVGVPGVPTVRSQTVSIRPGANASFALGGQRALPGDAFTDQVIQVFVRLAVRRVGPLIIPAGQLNLHAAKEVLATFHYTAWAPGIL